VNRIFKYQIKTLFCSLFITTLALSQATIKTTKHNLSTTGTGTIKASVETQVCIFCHTPHSKVVTTQLWNHQPTTATYTLYSSDYLTSLSYNTPNQPNAKSKLCLSCHDGTIALGAVYSTSGSGSTGTIAISGGVTTMPSGSSGNIGTTLTNDHPVGFGYDASKDPQLISRTWPWNTPIKLDPDASTGKVECHTCHNPHDNTNTKFLKISNTNAAVCTFCHNKTNWVASIHKTSTQSYTPSGSLATTIGEWACRNCHQSHNGQGVPYLLKLSEENTCYQSSCHGSTLPGFNTKDIQTQAKKIYMHPINTISGKHKNPDNSISLNVPNRHAECNDCHNAHQAKDGLHTLKSNAVSNVLTGVFGVTPGTATIWTQPTTFTIINPATQENQICFKCHSYNAFGFALNGVTTIVGQSGVNITDQAMEFNTANKSAHPVVVSTNNQTGSTAPKALTTTQMSTTWNSVGTQTMYCTDCHGNDQATSATVPQGPHGSNAKFILTGTAKYWPLNSSGALWSLNDLRNNLNNWSTNLFCVNCHPIYSGGSFKNNTHSRNQHQGVGVKCVACHVTVPHGAKRSRLIGYRTDVYPYNYNGTGQYEKLVISGFRKASSPNNYSKSDCTFTSGCHGTQSGTYEP
jgi:predicted CXXCH cytochrome family protein